MHRLSYIVSAYNRPDHLPCVLWSLKVQSHRDFQVIVADNAVDPAILRAHRETVAALKDDRFSHCQTGLNDCYWAAEKVLASGQATGEFVCFPSDDSYYVPEFGERMLRAAAVFSWDLVYCDMVYDPRMWGVYAPFQQRPAAGGVDKTGFILRRSLFTGFPGKPPEAGGTSWADGELVASLVARGVRHGGVKEILVVHN